MRTSKSFINVQSCTKIANNLREWAELGGCDAYDTFLSKEKCDNAADQFEIQRDKNGGNYFSNIINKPFFTDSEIEIIINML